MKYIKFIAVVVLLGVQMCAVAMEDIYQIMERESEQRKELEQARAAKFRAGRFQKFIVEEKPKKGGLLRMSPEQQREQFQKFNTGQRARVLAEFNNLGSSENWKGDNYEKNYRDPVIELLKNPSLLVAQTEENDPIVIAIQKKDFKFLEDLIDNASEIFKNPDITFKNNDGISALDLLRRLEALKSDREYFGYNAKDVRQLKAALLGYQPKAFTSEEQELNNIGNYFIRLKKVFATVPD